MKLGRTLRCCYCQAVVTRLRPEALLVSPQQRMLPICENCRKKRTC